jgi:thioredoxin-related protein
MKRFGIFPVLMIACTMRGYSQMDTTKGIAFVQNLSWQEILKKASVENKYIFVDCFATWCGPCKIMDKTVYPNDSVGDIMNERFISVRIQMDTTKEDKEGVRQWYLTAHDFTNEYHIDEYPAYLFFSPEGKAVHKRFGEMNKGDFLAMAQAAVDTNQQYYTLLHKYRNGVKSYVWMPNLARAADDVGNSPLFRQVAEDYIHDYLDQLPEGLVWNKENVELFRRFSYVMKCSDRIFKFFYQNRIVIDSIMKEPDFADGIINRTIYSDLIKPYLDSNIKNGVKADWPGMKHMLEGSYDVSYVHKNVLDGQIEYYKARKEWEKYLRYFMDREAESGLEKGELNASKRIGLNNAAYEVFQYGNNRQLKKALSWVELALSPGTFVDAMDTKANILYKLGRKQEGLVLEEQAHALVSKASPSYADIQSNYEKMKKGLPTWIYK